MKSPAKLNLFLNILERRPDGFHDLRTILHRVTLADDLELVPVGPRADTSRPLVLRFIIDGPEAAGVPANESNLIWRALALIDREARRPLPRLKIYLYKRIPHGAGLGGGSSNAAAALVHANERFQLGVPAERLHALAAAIGSDCPFFLLPPGAAEATGRGEVLTAAPARPGQPLLLVMPDFTVNTKEAYGLLRPEHFGPRTDAAAVHRWLADPAAPLPEFHNAFEPALAARHPVLAALRSELHEHGALAARLTGSGSATFALFPDEATRDAAAEALRRPGLRVWATSLQA